MAHTPVFTTEAISALNFESDSIVVDCTFGAGGYAKAILAVLNSTGVYVGIDADKSAFEAATNLQGEATVHLVNDNFRNIKKIMTNLDIRPNAIVADLGWREEQFMAGGKGFSFKKDEPLRMTYGNPKDALFTAETVVNEWDETSLRDIITGFGEERYAGKIAAAIVSEREVAPIKTSGQLAEIVTAALPTRAKHSRLHPATKTFQAIRMAVNDELGALEALLTDGFDALKPGGRLAIVSFHSLEDRLVKRTFRDLSHKGLGTRLTKKPIVPSQEELLENPRARSAKLRVIQKNHD